MNLIKILKKRGIIYCLLIIALAVTLFPILWIFLTSIKLRVDIFSMPPKWFFAPTLSHYLCVIYDYPFLKFFTNSLIVSIGTVCLAIIIGSLAAYGFDRFRLKGSNSLMIEILTFRMFPPVACILPLYLLWAKFGLVDTLWGLILAYLIFTLPLVVWLMKGFFEGVPKDLDEAAMVDGYSRIGAFRRVILPIAKPGMWAVMMIIFIFCWNEFLFALVLTGRFARTMPVAVAEFNTQRGILWGEMAAATMLLLIPVIVVAIIVHKHLTKGMTLGAVKG